MARRAIAVWSTWPRPTVASILDQAGMTTDQLRDLL
jgi:hypothetical protein